jgi:hypothetical protein
LPTDQLAQFLGEQKDIQDWFKSVQEHVGETGGPLLGVVCESLVWIGDPVVQIANFVVVHVSQVPLVEMICQLLSELQGQLALKVVDCRVNSRGWQSEHQQNKNLKIVRGLTL